MGDQRNGQDPARAQGDPARETLRAKMHLTVPTQSSRAHGHRLDHRAIGANLRPSRVNQRLSITQQGDIRRGPPNVRHQSMIPSRHPTGPHNGCGGAAQNGFNGPLLGLLRRNQSAIAAHNHQGRSEADLAQNIFRPTNELMGHADQSGIQHSG